MFRQSLKDASCSGGFRNKFWRFPENVQSAPLKHEANSTSKLGVEKQKRAEVVVQEEVVL